MYNSFQLVSEYLHYYFTASNGKGHGTHSPFVFEFITKVLNDKTEYDAYKKVEQLRKELLRDKTILSIDDYGAGSAVSKKNKRTVSAIARNSAKSKKLAQLLFRMVKKYQPEKILELGTSLGITTSYLSYANPYSGIISLEGAGEAADVARRNFDKAGIRNISIVKGNFDSTLLKVLEELKQVDFAFIDGNHRQEPTERYFLQLLPFLNNDSIVVFDDIHWSREMAAAWKTIKKYQSVNCSIDLFFIGIVLFKNEFKEKQHFKIRF